MKILILGCCGSGKSTFAIQLSEKTGIPAIHLDQLFWKPGWVESSKPEFDQTLLAALDRPEWIIDGNYSRTLPQRLRACDRVFLFRLPRRVCLCGILRRYLRYHGRTRPDMTGGCPEQLDGEFLRYTWNFEKTQGEKLRNLIRDSGKPCTVFRSRRQADKYLNNLCPQNLRL